MLHFWSSENIKYTMVFTYTDVEPLIHYTLTVSELSMSIYIYVQNLLELKAMSK